MRTSVTRERLYIFLDGASRSDKRRWSCFWIPPHNPEYTVYNLAMSTKWKLLTYWRCLCKTCCFSFAVWVPALYVCNCQLFAFFRKKEEFLGPLEWPLPRVVSPVWCSLIRDILFLQFILGQDNLNHVNGIMLQRYWVSCTCRSRNTITISKSVNMSITYQERHIPLSNKSSRVGVPHCCSLSWYRIAIYVSVQGARQITRETKVLHCYKFSFNSVSMLEIKI